MRRLIDIVPNSSKIPRCFSCGRFNKDASFKGDIFGEGRSGIMLVGGSPSREDVFHGTMFYSYQQDLEGILRQYRMRMKRDCWGIYSVACPGRVTDKMIPNCSPNVFSAMKEKKPKVVVLVGQEAVNSVIGGIWKKSPGAISKWTGTAIPDRDRDCWICPVNDPVIFSEKRGIIYETEWKKHWQQIRDKLTEKIQPIPGEHEIEIIYSPEEAAGILQEFLDDPAPVAFDYETNMLKPDSRAAEIVSCAVTWRGERTIAFPWEGRAIEAMKRILLSPDHGKIASNLKFEERWTKAKLGINVENWLWDTMLAAHVSDNRSGITSIKFQSFVLLGAKSYDDEVGPFLRSGKPNEPNRIRECDIKKLLKYNGLDAKLEYQVAMKQMRLFGYPFAEEEEYEMPKVPKNNPRRRGSFQSG